MNQTQLATLVLCSKSHISDIELGHVLPNLHIQVMPFTVTEHPGGDGPLRVVDYQGKPPVWFTEGPRSGRMSDDRAEVISALTSLNLIRSAALPVGESVELIRSARESRYEQSQQLA
jgi:hypothetical protein